MDEFLDKLDAEQGEAERDRHQARIEMEQTLIAQEQMMERDTGSPIYEQADGTSRAADDGHNVITASHAGGASNTDAMASGAVIGSPGAGTDLSETQTSSEPDLPDDKPSHVELSGSERMFEGEGSHDTHELDNHDHAFERLRDHTNID